MKMNMEVDGLKELEAQLANLDHIGQKKILRKTARESAKPIERSMINNMKSAGHVDTGLLGESIKTKVSFPKQAKWADAIASTGVFKQSRLMKAAGLDPKKDIPPTVYAWWLEHGTQAHMTGKGSRTRKAGSGGGLHHPGIPAKPFMRPAFDSQIEDTLSIQKTILSREIDKAIAKVS